MSDLSIPLILSLAGGFGGLLFGMRELGLALPGYDSSQQRLSLGFVADAFFGVAGAFVIFLLVPADFTVDKAETTIKLVALALIGGYAGPALLDKLVSETLRDVKRETSLMRNDLEQQKVLQAKADAQRQRDLQALITVDQYLNDTEDGQVARDALAEVVAAASQEARIFIYEKARHVRRTTWATDPKATERTVPVFEALLAVGITDCETHRLCAQLAYALKDKPDPDYVQASELLSRAIVLRQQAGLAPSAWYHFNRALCAISLEREGLTDALPADYVARTVDDVAIAEDNPVMARAIAQSTAIQDWLGRHRTDGPRAPVSVVGGGPAEPLERASRQT